MLTKQLIAAALILGLTVSCARSPRLYPRVILHSDPVDSEFWLAAPHIAAVKIIAADLQGSPLDLVPGGTQTLQLVKFTADVETILKGELSRRISFFFFAKPDQNPTYYLDQSNCGSDNAVYVAVRDNFNAVWMTRVFQEAWTGWSLGGGVTATDPLLSGTGAAMYTTILDGSGALWYRPFLIGPGNNWQSWVRIGGVLQSIGTSAAGLQEVTCMSQAATPRTPFGSIN